MCFTAKILQKNCQYCVFCSGGWEFCRNIETKIQFLPQQVYLPKLPQTLKTFTPMLLKRENLFTIDSVEVEDRKNLHAQKDFPIQCLYKKCSTLDWPCYQDKLTKLNKDVITDNYSFASILSGFNEV